MQAYAVYEIEFRGEYLLRRMAAEDMNQQRDNTFHQLRVRVPVNDHFPFFHAHGKPHLRLTSVNEVLRIPVRFGEWIFLQFVGVIENKLIAVQPVLKGLKFLYYFVL